MVKLVLSEWLEEQLKFMPKPTGRVEVSVRQEIDKDDSTIFIHSITKNKTLSLGIKEFCQWFNIDTYNSSIKIHLSHIGSMLSYMCNELENEIC